MPTQLIMQSLSKAIIQNITFLLLSSDFYVSIKDKTDISARVISKIHYKYYPKATVTSGSHLTKLSDANIIYTKRLFHINKSKQLFKLPELFLTLTVSLYLHKQYMVFKIN